MAVAEKPITEKASRSAHHQLALSSLLGALYVLFALGMVFSGLPVIWHTLFPMANAFLSSSLLIMVDMGAIVGFLFLGWALEKNNNPPHGFRAGVFVLCAAIVLILWISLGVGSLLASKELGGFGVFLTFAVAGAFAFVVVKLFLKAGFAAWLGHVEDQGWFHATSYKGNQGVRVRRGTMLALLGLGICGIITLITHRAFGYERLGVSNDWEMVVPFSEVNVEDYTNFLAVPIMFQVHYTMPLVLSLLLVWVSWRVVNWPVFADFLIATEAEMNKVSWSTRKRLFQDTIVVLVTVTLLTTFLFVIDILWIKVLSAVQVLRVDVRAEQAKQQEKSQW